MSDWIRLDRHPLRQTEKMLGRRVRLTDEARRAGFRGRARTNYGKVVRVYALSGEYVEVRRDGIKGKEGYAASFWEARP